MSITEHESPMLQVRVPKLLRLDDVRELTGLSRTAIYEEMARGRFPGSYELTGRARCWKLEEITEWADNLKPASVPPTPTQIDAETVRLP